MSGSEFISRLTELARNVDLVFNELDDAQRAQAITCVMYLNIVLKPAMADRGEAKTILRTILTELENYNG